MYGFYLDGYYFGFEKLDKADVINEATVVAASLVDKRPSTSRISIYEGDDVDNIIQEINVTIGNDTVEYKEIIGNQTAVFK